MDTLKPYGELDVLSLYSKVAPYLLDFLRNREIASKTWIPKAKIPFFLNRAGKLGELWIDDFKHVDDKFLKMRANHHLSDVKNRLNDRQILLWRYFVPRKYSEFFMQLTVRGKESQLTEYS